MATEQYPATLRLRQIPGVGPLTALRFLLTVEDPALFAPACAVDPHRGLVIRRHHSRQFDKRLGLTQAGHVQLRCLLVNCAHYILDRYRPPAPLHPSLRSGPRLPA